MFNGIGSVSSSSFSSESEQQTEDRRENEDNPQGDKDGSVNLARTDTNNTEELIVRLQDLENRMPALRPLDGNDTPIPILVNTATIEDVINVVNRLIKRDISFNELQYRIK